MGIITPGDGEICVNTNTNSYIADASLRKLFAYVPQGNMILSGSIRDNISFLNSNINEEKIIEAAKIACIWDVIKELPDGLDTILGEGGTGLSEGQVQRLAVARAICSDAPILLLDDIMSDSYRIACVNENGEKYTESVGKYIFAKNNMEVVDLYLYEIFICSFFTSITPLINPPCAAFSILSSKTDNE